MKILIVTQAIDLEHPILGFFHRWVEEFAKHCEHVHVICLQDGKHDFPKNVTVYSLGKEEGRNRLVYLLRFYKLIWQLRNEYDNVFVHMNQIYVILGASLWRALGKKVGLWYMHGTVSNSLKLAEKLTNNIFTGSPESCRLDSDKILVTGHGIDTDKFKPLGLEKNIDLISVGRITKSKNLIALVDILSELCKTIDTSLTFVGGAVTDSEAEYEKNLRDYVEVNGLEEKVHFVGRIMQSELPEYLNRAKVFVTTAQNGSLDKAILEALATGLPVVSMAPGTKSLMLGDSQVEDSEAFINQLNSVIESGVYMSEANMDFVRKNHSIESLIPKILNSY